MTEPVIIITYARSLMALTVAQSVRPMAGRLIGVDSVDWTVLAFSGLCDETRRIPDPNDAPDDYIAALAELSRNCREETGAPVLIMPVFEDTPLLAEHRGAFPDGVTIAAPPAEAIAQVHPKDRLARSATSWGVPAPDTQVLTDPDPARRPDVEDALPAILKPAEGCGGRGITLVEDAETLEAELADRDDTTLVQSPAPGDDYCVTAMADGETVFALSAYRNLEQFPPQSGAGALRETVDAAPFRSAMDGIARNTGWTGTLQADFRWTGEANDTPKLIEINARLWAGITHSVHSGVDYPLLLAKQALGEALPDAGEPEIGYRSKLPFLWLAGLTGKSLDQAEYLAQIEANWRELKEADASLVDRIGQLWQDMTDFETLKEDIDTALERSRLGGDADADVGPSEAGSTALGSLFILSHLLRHGRLPAEVKHD
jgi:predicted ATP-grasp superfamily ATP-dependent carboligase